jgi:hypothetical protein
MKKASATGRDAEEQLSSFIEKFTPERQKLIRGVRKALRRRFPTANELVYDNYNFFVIGYSATERPSDTICSIAAAANGVGLSFYRGASVPDPEGLLQGSGSQNRFVRLPNAETLAVPGIAALISAAKAQAPVPLPESGRGKLIIRSIAARQRPRQRKSA